MKVPIANPALAKFLAIITMLIVVLVIAAALSTVLSASTVCPPVMYPDSVRVNPACPGLTSTIIVGEGASVWDAWANDNPPTETPHGIQTGDGDYNDWIGKVFISADHDVRVQYLGEDSGWVDVVTVNGSAPIGELNPGPVDIGTFPVGTEIVLYLHAQDGGVYLSGDLARNGGYSNWWIDGPGDPVPEPSQWVVVGTVMIGMAALRFRKQHIRKEVKNLKLKTNVKSGAVIWGT